MDKRYRPLSTAESQTARRALAEELAAAPSTPIPAVIRKIRTTLRFTIAEYANLCGVSARALADIERETTSPTLSTVEKLLRPLGMQPGAVPAAHSVRPAPSAAQGAGPLLQNAQDRSRINLAEAWEVNYWTRELGVSQQELADAISAAGPTIGAVRRHLGK